MSNVWGYQHSLEIASLVLQEFLQQPKRTQCKDSPQIVHLYGNATEPRDTGPRLIVHIVNDRTPNWGGGFAQGVKKKWKSVQDDFRMWVNLNRQNLTLGNTHLSHIEGSLSIVHMIAQRGYGPSKKPRIRYAALSMCLDQVAELACRQRATVHMPRIGTGQAGGQWAWIRELIDDRLVRRGIPVFVYELPDSVPVEPSEFVRLVIDSLESMPCQRNLR